MKISDLNISICMCLRWKPFEIPVGCTDIKSELVNLQKKANIWKSEQIQCVGPTSSLSAVLELHLQSPLFIEGCPACKDEHPLVAVALTDTLYNSCWLFSLSDWHFRKEKPVKNTFFFKSPVKLSEQSDNHLSKHKKVFLSKSSISALKD